MGLKFKDWSQWQKIENDYWQTTYRALNPFMPPVICKDCDAAPTKKRWRDAEGAPVTEYEFKCPNGHVWGLRKTYD